MKKTSKEALQFTNLFMVLVELAKRVNLRSCSTRLRNYSEEQLDGNFSILELLDISIVIKINGMQDNVDIL